MIEFDDTFSKQYSGKEALIQRINTRIRHTTSDIPYYTRGVDVAEFAYGSQVAAIKLAFRDLGPSVTYDENNSRVQYYDISIPVDTALGEQ